MGFAPRHYFSSLVTARLFLYFSHFYYFFVAITPGLQTTVSSVVWSACFCCCLLYRLQADSQPVRIPFHRRQSKTNRQKFACSFCLAEAKGFAPRHYFSSLVLARILLYFSHFYYFFVAITPGLQTTVSSVVWSACFCCCLLYRLQADSQPVRIPFHRRQSKTNRQKFACSFCLAEAKGFEPLRLLGKRFSRPPRYDHFDKLPFI